MIINCTEDTRKKNQHAMHHMPRHDFWRGLPDKQLPDRQPGTRLRPGHTVPVRCATVRPPHLPMTAQAEHPVLLFTVPAPFHVLPFLPARGGAKQSTGKKKTLTTPTPPVSQQHIVLPVVGQLTSSKGRKPATARALRPAAANHIAKETAGNTKQLRQPQHELWRGSQPDLVTCMSYDRQTNPFHVRF